VPQWAVVLLRITGGDPLKGALLGAATGGIGHGIAGATAGGGAGAAGATGISTIPVGETANLAATAGTEAAATAGMRP
jgi:hypothetical protein